MWFVAACSNRLSDSITLHVFPKDEKQRSAWTRFVKLTRADWHGPSQYTVICSKYFKDDCFEASFSLMKYLRMSAKRRLCPGSTPSLYLKRKIDDLNTAFIKSPTGLGSPATKRQAVVKCEKKRILAELLSEDTHEPIPPIDSEIVPVASENGMPQFVSNFYIMLLQILCPS
ncbi:uncharacterized protein LOC133194330 [Saccostrea echinata]|uniref:uncharacterized protein LOC133194330 n=1 Tax=Saccostrea echinata TaxID=191078 RepID=UPI002A7F37D6|nr:uncharacterized protein LOC133194330 [Saccostrea echinata]